MVAEDLHATDRRPGGAFQINFNGCQNLEQLLTSMDCFMQEVTPCSGNTPVLALLQVQLLLANMSSGRTGRGRILIVRELDHRLHGLTVARQTIR